MRSCIVHAKANGFADIFRRKRYGYKWTITAEFVYDIQEIQWL